MAGANYMGGKRNAIRARTKDVTSRLQKGHFGKQRLNLLAHGLIQNSTRVLEQGARITAIDFAHARRQHPMLESVQTLIPQPISSIDTESHNSTSSAEHPPSRPKLTKFLRAFEQFEPISFCSKRRRLLEVPDFAGLVSHTKEMADRKRVAWIPGRQRKEDDSDLLPAAIDQKRRLFTVDMATDDVSSTDVPPSPSPAMPPRLSVPTSKPSSIYSFQSYSDYSDIYTDDHASPPGRHNLKHELCKDSYSSERKPPAGASTLCQDEHIFGQWTGIIAESCDAEHNRETWQSSKAPIHPLPESLPSVELIDMSEEWLAMAKYLRVGDCHTQQATAFPGNTQVFGRLGVDFHVIPHLKPSGSDRLVKSSTASNLTMVYGPSDTNLSPFTPKHSSQPITPSSAGCGVRRSIVLEPWEEEQGQKPSIILPAPSPTFSPLPISQSICFPSMELLHYDTQLGGELSSNFANLHSQLLSGDDLVSTNISVHTHSSSPEFNFSNDKAPFIVEKLSQDRMSTNSEHLVDHTESPTAEENLSQKIAFYTPPPHPVLSYTPTGGNHIVQHDTQLEPMFLAADIMADKSPTPLEDVVGLQQGNDIAKPENDVGTDLQHVDTGNSLVGRSVDGVTGIAATQSVHLNKSSPADVATYITGSQTHTKPDEASREWRVTPVSCDQGDTTRPDALIEGPLLFTHDNEDDEDY